ELLKDAQSMGDRDHHDDRDDRRQSHLQERAWRRWRGSGHTHEDLEIGRRTSFAKSAGGVTIHGPRGNRRPRSYGASWTILTRYWASPATRPSATFGDAFACSR